MNQKILQKLADKSITKEGLLQRVKQDFGLLPEVVEGVSSPKPNVRYGCAKVLMDLSGECPERVYPYMDFFVGLLHSKYRILTWNALATIANLARVDAGRKFDAIFDKYFGLLNDPYMVTVANVVGNSAKVAQAKPYLTHRIVSELLRVESLKTTPHLTEECRRVIAEKTIEAFDTLFDQIRDKKIVVAFVRNCVDSSRETLRKSAEHFLQKHCSMTN